MFGQIYRGRVRSDEFRNEISIVKQLNVLHLSYNVLFAREIGNNGFSHREQDFSLISD